MVIKCIARLKSDAVYFYHRLILLDDLVLPGDLAIISAGFFCSYFCSLRCLGFPRILAFLLGRSAAVIQRALQKKTWQRIVCGTHTDKQCFISFLLRGA